MTPMKKSVKPFPPSPNQPVTVNEFTTPAVVLSPVVEEKPTKLPHRIIKFIAAAFSEKGEPSSARILSAWLSLSSMALIWFMIRHAFYTDNPEKLITWVGGLPAIIYALAAFAISPLGLAKISSIWNKKDNGENNGNGSGKG